MFKDKKAVIFDLDGTLVSSGFVWYKVDQDFFGKRGMEIPKDYITKISSMSFYETAKFTKSEYNIDESEEEIMKEWYDMAAYEYANEVKLKDGAAKILEKLRAMNFKIGLATATSHKLFVPCLKNNNIYDYFDSYVYGDEVKKSKEFPDIYLLCAQRLGASPDECIVFEDISRGIIGAKKAGMKTCGVYDDYTSFEWEKLNELADVCVRSLTELL